MKQLIKLINDNNNNGRFLIPHFKLIVYFARSVDPSIGRADRPRCARPTGTRLLDWNMSFFVTNRLISIHRFETKRTTRRRFERMKRIDSLIERRNRSPNNDSIAKRRPIYGGCSPKRHATPGLAIRLLKLSISQQHSIRMIWSEKCCSSSS